VTRRWKERGKSLSSRGTKTRGGHVRPGLQRPWFAEHSRARRTVVPLIRQRHLRVDIVEEDLLHCVGAPVTHRSMPVEEICNRLGMPRVLPPLARRLAWLGDHRGEQQEPCHRDPRRHERAAERAEGLRNHHQVAAAVDGCRHCIRVVTRGGELLMKRKRRRHRFVAEIGEGCDRSAEDARVRPRAGDQDEHRNSGDDRSLWQTPLPQA
jgi:hypothetical protein